MEITFLTITSQDEEEGTTENEDTGLESTVISLGAGVKKRVTLNTAVVQQKLQAARILYKFAQSMRGYLKAHIAPALQALLGLVTDKHSVDIRSSSALGLAQTFDALVHAAALGFVSRDSSELEGAMSAILVALLQNIKTERNVETRACAAEAFRDVLQVCYIRIYMSLLLHKVILHNARSILAAHKFNNDPPHSHFAAGVLPIRRRDA
jgi:hypothetical protein